VRHCLPARNAKETKMPKMKTKSSAKKRFKVSATGKVITAQAGKRHGMIKRTNKFIRDARGTTTLSEPDAKIVKGFMPYDR
jgi:large subunit ribosomal protein L35